MKSITSEAGPSIVGYDRSRIDSEISSTESAYNSAKSNFASKESQFLSDVSTAQNRQNVKNSTYNAMISAQSFMQQASNAVTLRQQDYNSAVQYLNSLSKNDPRYASAEKAVENAEDNLNDAKDARDDAIDAYNGARSSYNSAFSAWQSANQTLNSSRNAYKYAADDAFNASIAYGNALARSQMGSDQDASREIASIIAQFASKTIPQESDLQGLTLSAYQDLQRKGDDSKSQREALIPAFNTYRYIEASMAYAWTSFFKEQADHLYGQISETPYDRSKFVAAHTRRIEINDSRLNAATALETALSAYSSSYQNVDTTLRNIISAAKAQTDQWSQYLATKQAQVGATVSAALNQHITDEQSAKDAYTTTYPDKNPEYTKDRLVYEYKEYTAQTKMLRASGSGVLLSSVAIPKLPVNTGAVLSISEIMDIFAKIGIMTSDLSKLMSRSDNLISSFLREIGQNDANYLLNSRTASDAWDRIKYGVDLRYNTNTDEENEVTYIQVTNIYKVYQNNVALINDVITQINSEIRKNNTTTKELVDAVNSLSPKIIQAINEAYQNRSDTKNKLDYSESEPNSGIPTPLSPRSTLEYPAEIPLYELLESLSPPPEANFDGEPASLPSIGEINAFNATIDIIVKKLAPFLPRVQKELIANTFGSQEELRLLNPQKLYFRKKVEIRDGFLKTTYDGFLSLIQAFSQQISSMARADEDRSNNARKNRTGLFSRDPLISQAPQNSRAAASATVSDGISFSNTEMEANPSNVGKIINQVIRSDQFSSVLYNLYERISLQAGLQVAGSAPKTARTISEMGIPLNELLEEDGISILQLMDQEITQEATIAMINLLAAAVQDEETLFNNAIQLMESSGSMNTATEAELKEALLELVAIQQLQLIQLALFMGFGAQIAAEDLLSSLQENPTQKALLDAGIGSGIPSNSMEQIISALGSKIHSMAPLFSELGIEQEEQKALLLLIGANSAKVSLTNNVPGGAAFKGALLQKLKASGLEVPQAMESPLFPAQIQAILHQKAELQGKMAITLNAIQKAFSGEASTSRATSSLNSSPIVSASAILKEAERKYRAIPAELRAALGKASGQVSALSNEAKETLTFSLLSQAMSLKETGALIALLGIERDRTIDQALMANDFTKALFEPTEKGKKSTYRVQKEDFKQQIERPATLPKETREIVRQAFETVANKFELPESLYQFLERSTYTNQKMLNFNIIAVDYLLNPAKIIIREFSAITRSSGDKLKQSPMMIGG